MAEGLDPIEAGKKLHEHASEVHAHRRDGGGGRAEAGDRHSRVVQICEAALLALVTITAAWAGYAAARWGTASRVDIARSTTLRSLATRSDLSALTTRNFDSSTFNTWFTAFTLNSPRKEEIAERRFRPAFRVAFNAWMAIGPLHNPHASPGPTYMPQYKLPAQAQASALDSAADAMFDAGNHDGLVSDDYIRLTVFLAAVLFMVGIGSSFKLHGIRYAVITFGSVVLILAVVLIHRRVWSHRLAVIPELLSHGHQVAGLGPPDSSAQAVAALGAQVRRGDLNDLPELRQTAAGSGAVINLALKHEAMRAGDFRGAIAAGAAASEAIGQTLAHSGKPFVNTGGTLMLAMGGITGRRGTEEDVIADGTRVDAENAVAALAERGVRFCQDGLAPLVHNHLDEHGFTPALIGFARQHGAAYIGDGANRWPAAHTRDIAVLSASLEKSPAGSRLHGVGDEASRSRRSPRQSRASWASRA